MRDTTTPRARRARPGYLRLVDPARPEDVELEQIATLGRGLRSLVSAGRRRSPPWPDIWVPPSCLGRRGKGYPESGGDVASLFRISSYSTTGRSPHSRSTSLHEAFIKLRYIQPRRPQQNGKVERSHRIDSEEFWRPEAPPDFSTALPALHAWERRYSFERFSVALNGETPAENSTPPSDTRGALGRRRGRPTVAVRSNDPLREHDVQSPAMPRARVNGVSLYYEVNGHGPPLVLVHGFACGLRTWDPQVRALARSWRVVTYDVRGHGISEAPADAAAYSQPASVADLRALLEYLEIPRAAVGGLSMGGNIALNFALAHPEMASALIVADTGAGSDETADWVATVHAFAQALEREGLEAFADAAMANPLFSRYLAQGPAAERFIRSCLVTHRARGLAHTAREVLAKRPTIYALGPRLRELSVPTLLIVGEHDEPCVNAHRFMADTIPGARHVLIPDVGHLTNLEATRAFNRAVTAFLRKAAR